MDMIIGCIIENMQWLFSGIGIFIIGYFIKNRKDKKSKLKASNNISVSEQEGINSSVIAVNEVNNSPITQIGNQNNYYQSNMQKKLSDKTISDNREMLFMYLQNTSEKLKLAYSEINVFVTTGKDGNVEKAISCINHAIIDNQWNDALKQSDLSSKSVMKVKLWYSSIVDLSKTANQQSINNMQKLAENIFSIMNDPEIKNIISKLNKEVD